MKLLTDGSKKITTEPEILPPVDESDWENEGGAFALSMARNITPVDKPEQGVVD